MRLTLSWEDLVPLSSPSASAGPQLLHGSAGLRQRCSFAWRRRDTVQVQLHVGSLWFMRNLRDLVPVSALILPSLVPLSTLAWQEPGTWSMDLQVLRVRAHQS